MNDLRLHKSPNGATVFHLYACRGKEEAHGDRDDGGYFTHNVKVHLTEKITVGTLIEKVRDGVQRKVGDTQTPGMHLYGPVNLNQPFTQILGRIQKAVIVAVHYNGDLNIQGVQKDVYNVLDKITTRCPHDVDITVFLQGDPLHKFELYPTLKHLQPEPEAIREHIAALYASSSNGFLAVFGHGVKHHAGEGLLLAPGGVFTSPQVLEDGTLAQLQVERMTRKDFTGTLVILADTCKSGENPSPQDVMKKMGQARSVPEMVLGASGHPLVVEMARLGHELYNGYCQYAAQLFYGLSYGFLVCLVGSMFFALLWAVCLLRDSKFLVAAVCATLMALVAEAVLTPTLASYNIAVHDRAFLGVFALFVALSAILCQIVLSYREIRSGQWMQSLNVVSNGLKLRSLSILLLRFYIFGGGEDHPQGIRCADYESAFYHPFHNATHCYVPTDDPTYPLRLLKIINYTLMHKSTLVTCNYTVFKSRVQAMLEEEKRKPAAFYIGNTVFDLSDLDDGADVVRKLTSGAPQLDFFALRTNHAKLVELYEQQNDKVDFGFPEIKGRSLWGFDALGFLAFKTLAVLSDALDSLIAFAGTRLGFACIVAATLACGVALGYTPTVRKTVEVAGKVVEKASERIEKLVETIKQPIVAVL